MVNWLTSLFTTARHEVEFRLQDRESRRAEIEDAIRKFPMEELKRDLDEARRRLAAEVERRFDTPMRANRASLQAIRPSEAAFAGEHAGLTRDHAGELKEAYAGLDCLKSDMATAKRAVGDALADLKQAKARVSSWHNRSKSRFPIYGKRGKPIPRHSFFFSQSDLDSAKRDADRAADRIGDAIRSRDRVYAEMKRCGDWIGEIKESRARRLAMLEAGRTRSQVLADAAALQFEIVRLIGAEGRMQQLRDECVANSVTAEEIGKLKDQIREARERQADRLKAFNGADARASRRGSYHPRPARPATD